MVNPAPIQQSPVAILAIEELQKSYGAIEVLKSISLSIDAGDFLVLVGPSGCGKSTLLNCIAGLEETSAGTICIDGRDVTNVPPRDRDIAMVFQSYALYPTMTVAENIAFGMKIRRVEKSEQKRKIGDVARLLQIEHLLGRRPAHLSGGQRQRVAMGRALVREPKLFLFDEPLSNLDAKLRVEMRAEIKALHQRLDASIVYVTHDQIEAMTLGTKIVVLKDGVIQQFATPAEIYDAPANLFVADFMGSPPMNLIEARVGPQKQGVSIRFGEGTDQHVITGTNPPAALAAYADKPVIVGIRPEDFAVARDDSADLTLRAEMTEHAGSDNFATFALAGKKLMTRLSGKSPIAVGDEVPLSVDTSHICYFDPQTTERIA
ncbi:ABC transporter ATP-binding protein [Pelagibacterium halotolerans]|uniref:ABC transporter related protein n=1 Tax=Pelagibacterium halotolerans (strain DSM 22347 / JCM 15775 / CGMCC 1.7692 / B2) TaxID=1082931 RepID=G4RAA2_PELHB|nr:sn-glycerol-3-phosphate ABC transporter ATP-binding protein UgpC [Pelagibacterium halotolerans]AEQ50461.1 ABC transporter related protein [Pelagibacterium halotolerans B2]QJR19577.1 sn-glycerol-3-phosphate ABC transporter ATP-binding protein UgpC [Pelagibacterium halotolerans]SDZ87549.1 carbohydrate ABC transporter ATP-binding protein, CUT1 family [Pelagibacterium halotolerans]